MTENQMFEKSFCRPPNYFDLSGESQWSIDKSLGILDWNGDLSIEDYTRFVNHYNHTPEQKAEWIEDYRKRKTK